MNRIRIKAPAKINLALEVLGKRPDGYHEIVTVLQTVALYDELILEPYPSLQVEGDLTGPEDLVIQAALALQPWAPQRGARIRLEKRIPVGASLGGGSSCAAATLLGLARLWDLKRAEEEEGLHRLAERLGSDVPFFLQALQGRGGTALAWGRGEQIKPLPSPPLNGWSCCFPLFIWSERRPPSTGFCGPSITPRGKRRFSSPNAWRRGFLWRMRIPRRIGRSTGAGAGAMS